MQMKKLIVFGIMSFVLAITSCRPSDEPYKDAVAVWHLSGPNDVSLTSYGDVQYITLETAEAAASHKRGGDGIAAKFNGVWLDAGQGIREELNLTGKNVSILVRMKADNVKGFAPIISKAGNDQNIAYRISLNTADEDVYIESMMGSDDIGGAHLLRYKLPKDEVAQWHDVLLRFNGKISELFVDGILRDDEVTVGDIRDWNRRPVLIGAQYKPPYGYAAATNEQVEAVFDGLIDHIALWNRCLSDKEVMKLSGVTEITDGKPEYYKEKYRPQFHFTAKKNWLNDPNGLVYYKGVYHLFFQYMPPHRPGAYKDWGHAVSTDLVHWEQIPGHIAPHKVWSGCWSGSAVVDVNNSAGFQTGDEKAIVAFITNGGNPGSGIGPLCTQCIAYSTDGGNTFSYYDQNPVIRHIAGANRDPKVVWDEDSKKWIMSLYMDKSDRYEYGLFSSSDLKAWKQISTVSLDGDTECPGFMPLPVDGDATNKKWLFYGALGKYMIGSFDGTNFKPETKVIQGDYGKNYYAAQTWSDAPDGRCIILAWMPTKRYHGMPFEQQMNFPADLTLRTTPEGIRAYKMPVPEIRNLYDKTYQWQNQFIKGTYKIDELNGDLYDMDVEVDVNRSSSFEIGLRNVTLYYDAVKKIVSCGDVPLEPAWGRRDSPNENAANNLGEAPLTPVNGKIKLRILLDRTSIEIFGNDGQVVITSCIMPDDNNKSYSFTSKEGVNLVSAKVYSLKSAWDVQNKK